MKTKELPQQRAFKLKDAFKIIGIGQTVGHQLIKEGKIRTIRLGPRLPLITAEEIDRLMREGLEVPPPKPKLVRKRS